MIPCGGFNSEFTLFDGTGNEIANSSECTGLGTSQNPNFQDGCLDAYISESLPSGSYSLALTQSGNDPNGALSDGFSQQGQGNFTCAPFSISGAFCNILGTRTTGTGRSISIMWIRRATCLSRRQSYSRAAALRYSRSGAGTRRVEESILQDAKGNHEE